tara:strand:- start:1077 stop:2306 length:1230 start_codon:yes stop_codon:yes gene_type:complete
MKIKPCIIGLGYVGLPVILNLSKKFDCFGFDIDKKRVETLKKHIDVNKEFKKKDFYKKKLKFTFKFNEIKQCNFFIVCVPTPTSKNKKPDLQNLNNAIKILSKIVKKNDIIFIESTIFPGLTKKYKNLIQQKTNLIYNKDFFMGYSPERVNPGDKSNILTKIEKIVSIDTKSKDIKSKVISVYKCLSKKVVFSNNIRAAETAKVIENIQRDLNIALINEILLTCKKLNINFSEVIRLAQTKWNFLKFDPGLVGGHCLPVDPYYLASIALKKNFKTRVTLSGRKVNDNMNIFVFNEIKKFLKSKNKSINSGKILLIGISYKPGIADMRNSLNFKILKKLIQKKAQVRAFDPYVKDDVKSKYKFIDKISIKNKFDAIVFLSKHKKFESEYKKLNIKENKTKLLDPFEYYKR